MPSFDIASKVDLQTLDNAVNVVKKEISTRYDFKGAHIQIDLDKKTLTLQVEAESDMQLRQTEDILISKSMRQGLDPNCFDRSKDFYASGKYIRKEIPVRNGISREDAKKIVKLIKESGLKVQASIMDDLVRVTGKKIDDLQEVIQASKSWDIGIPLQYENMRS